MHADGRMDVQVCFNTCFARIRTRLETWTVICVWTFYKITCFRSLRAVLRWQASNTPHTNIYVIMWVSLNIELWSKRIDGRGSIFWPPRSPDFSLFHSVLQGYVLSEMSSIQQMKGRIYEVTATSWRTWQQVGYKLGICPTTDGVNIQIICWKHVH